jgi:hypothetical protein
MIASSPPTLPSSQAAAAGPQRVPDPEAARAGTICGDSLSAAGEISDRLGGDQPAKDRV